MAGRVRGGATAALLTAGTLSLGAWRQLFRRPLPQIRGSLSLRGLEANVTIGRDRFGVPHVQAHSIADACFAQGFCIGQDRLWQLELHRRVATGRVSEFAGPEGLGVDRVMRTLGFGRLAQREANALPEPDRTRLDAYAAGINAAIAAARALPFELQLLRIEPEPWTAADSIALGKLVALGFSTNMETELLRAELIDAVGLEKAEQLEPRYPRTNPVIVEPGRPWSGPGLDLAAQLASVRQAAGMSLEPAGSNNWAVSGERSETGHPLLAGDPHITATMPSVWYAIELSTPELELRGGAMPGFPGIVIGQSHQVAWSFTNTMADVQDLFVERISSDDGPPTYEFEGETRPVTVSHEQIRVKGRQSPEPLEVWETHHGPIVTRLLGADEGDPLALAWTALREPYPAALGVECGRADSGGELVELFRDFTVPSMNMVWADAHGDIGYKLVGKLPRRRGACPDVPKPGWTGAHEWDGYVPYDELPELRNPPGGVIVTANNQIAPPDYPHHITSEYLDGYRAARIEELLAEQEHHSLDSFERIQRDVHSIPGRIAAGRLARLEPSGQREIRAIERLRSWDNELDPDTIAGTIYEAFMVHFARAVSEAAIGDPRLAERWRSKSELGFAPMTSSPWRFKARLLELWEEGDSELIGGRDWDDVALESLRVALDDLERRFGHDASGWRWGRVHGVYVEHSLGGGGRPINRLLDRLLSRRLPTGGSQETVSQTSHVMHRDDFRGRVVASFRLLADVASPQRSRWQHISGQSGHPASAHYDDLQADWVAGRTNPVAQPAVATLTLHPA